MHVLVYFTLGWTYTQVMDMEGIPFLSYTVKSDILTLPENHVI